MSRDRFGPPPANWPSNHTPPAQGAKEKFARDWKLVKRARFNAAKRFEHKNDASILAFAVAGMAGFLVPVYTLIFKDDLTAHLKNALDFSSYVTGAMSLILGLVEQAKEHSEKSRRFDLCGRQVNSVLRKLNTTSVTSEDDLKRLVSEYERALEKCGENHDDIDYELAKAQQAVEDARDEETKKQALKNLRWTKSQRAIQTYWLYAFIWLTPFVFGIFLWLI